MNKIIIGTRGSALALFQAEEVRRLLREAYPDLAIELSIIKTKGDKFLQMALDASGDKGLFTKEIENELLSGNIDIAVHSLKDLPVVPAPKTELCAILPREDVNDVLLGGYTLQSLPQNAVVGTSSPRRVQQLKVLRPDLQCRPIRGNVQTRIEKLKSGEYDAIVMAYAGLKRLNLQDEISYTFSIEDLVPAAGQAAIAVQMREGDSKTAKLLAKLHCTKTAFEVNTERQFLFNLGGGCAMPFGCYCKLLPDGLVQLRAFYQGKNKALRANIECTKEELNKRLEALIQEFSKA